MPFNFPFSYPYYNRYGPQRRYYMSSQRSNNNSVSPASNFSSVSDISSSSRVSCNSNDSNSSNTSSSSSHTSSKDVHFSNTESSNNHSDDRNLADDGDEKCVFEIFGLKIFFDDVLILCILFFLYNEDVKDYELFLCLILLLIT